MAKALKTVTRWRHDVREALDRHGLNNVPTWAVLAIMHVEGKGHPRPEDVFGGPDYAAEGILQITPIAAKDAGLDVYQIDGKETPWKDALRSLDVFGELVSRYVGDRRGTVRIFDYPAFWLTGSGTYKRAQRLEREGHPYWAAWYYATKRSNADAVTPDYLWDYWMRWMDAARAYFTQGKV